MRVEHHQAGSPEEWLRHAYMYGYKCEYCNGIVQQKIVKQGAFPKYDKNSQVVLTLAD